jgi:integrase
MKTQPALRLISSTEKIKSRTKLSTSSIPQRLSDSAISQKSRTLLYEKNSIQHLYADFLIERENDLSENTLLKYENTFKIFHFLTLEDFERRDFLAFATGHAPSDWQRNTLYLNLGNLCTFSNWLVKKKLATRRFRMDKKSYRLKRREFPTFSELDLIFLTLKNKYKQNHTKHRRKWHQLYLVARILFETGARISESLGIYVEDVKSYNGKKYIYLDGTKSPDSERSVSISDELALELFEFIRFYKLRGRLFSSERGNKFSRIVVTSELKELGQTLGISAPIHAHAFRYMFILQMILDGKTAIEVMTRAGHADAQMTIKYFNKVRHLYPDIEVSKDIYLMEQKSNKRSRFFQNKKRGENYD